MTIFHCDLWNPDSNISMRGKSTAGGVGKSSLICWNLSHRCLTCSAKWCNTLSTQVFITSFAAIDGLNSHSVYHLIFLTSPTLSFPHNQHISSMWLRSRPNTFTPLSPHCPIGHSAHSHYTLVLKLLSVCICFGFPSYHCSDEICRKVCFNQIFDRVAPCNDSSERWVCVCFFQPIIIMSWRKCKYLLDEITESGELENSSQVDSARRAGTMSTVKYIDVRVFFFLLHVGKTMTAQWKPLPVIKQQRDKNWGEF